MRIGKNFQEESKIILTDIMQIFSEETIDNIQEKISNIREDVKKLTQYLELAKDGNRAQRKELTSKMKYAYQLIQTIRTQLLGNEAKIQYRLYIRSDALEKVQIVDMNEDQLMVLVQRSGNDLRLKRAFGEIDSSLQNTKLQEIFNQKFNIVSQSLMEIELNRFIVPFYNITDILGSRIGAKNLYWQIDTTPGKSAYTPKMFNRGWIYQAFDATIDDFLSQGEISDLTKISNKILRSKYFLEYLDYDQVIGFKGGDVDLFQIKTNMANLMNITTLIKYLKIIDTILSPENFNDKAELIDYIKNQFTKVPTELSETIQNNIEKNVDKLFLDFKVL